MKLITKIILGTSLVGILLLSVYSLGKSNTVPQDNGIHVVGTNAVPQCTIH